MSKEVVEPKLMEPVLNVQRIMWTGTIWFGVAFLAPAITLGAILASGWRPSELSAPLGVIFWIGFFLTALSLGLIGWSGCPILEVSVRVADRNKTRTMQLGTLLLIVGCVASVFAILLGPAH